jgi:hypothetical protein
MVFCFDIRLHIKESIQRMQILNGCGSVLYIPQRYLASKDRPPNP